SRELAGPFGALDDRRATAPGASWPAARRPRSPWRAAALGAGRLAAVPAPVGPRGGAADGAQPFHHVPPHQWPRPARGSRYAGAPLPGARRVARRAGGLEERRPAAGRRARPRPAVGLP